MKTLLALVTLLLAPALGAATFEGTVNFKTTDGKNRATEMNYSVKDSRMRIDMKGDKDASGYTVMDLAKMEMMMVMESERMYMTMSLKDAAEKAAKEVKDEATFEKTNETDKILGYTATKYISTYKGEATDMWLAEGLGSFMMPGSNPMAGGRGSAPKGWERALQGKSLFPLRIVSKDKKGKETHRMEVTAIEKKKLPESLFAVPAGYSKFDMGNMGGMLKGLMQGLGK
ncbi:MAG: DUF4412 domain-containing protein [Opitutaceae bacterium]|nr:DUF4412 domain-containing protein [Opitutaceae bacterium]